MRTIFIADAHLAHPEDLNYRLLLAFLEQIRGTVSELCILGDLFDFWVGLPGMPLPDYQPVIEALEKLAAEGVRLTHTLVQPASGGATGFSYFRVSASGNASLAQTLSSSGT